MRILQANKAYYPHVGGVETVVKQLAEGFAASPGVESAVLACADDRRTSRRTECGVVVTRAATFGRVASLPVTPGLPLHLLGRRADILQLHEPSLAPSGAYLALGPAARARFGKLVVWWHSDIIGHDRVRPFYEPFHRRLLAAADAVIASSPNLIACSPTLRSVAHKCRVVHIGVEPERFADTPATTARVAEIRTRYNGRTLVLFAGRLVHYKGIEYLLEAMKSLPDVQLIVAGTGRLRPMVDTMAAECPGNVDVVGFVPDDDLVAYFKACDIFALPSVVPSEAYGIVQVEAMACGKPVVTTNLETGVTYVNQDGKTGLVVPRRDSAALATALRTLAHDPDLRGRMGDYARARVLREFTVDGMVQRTLEIYRELLA